MQLPMNNETPIATDGALARQETSPVPAEDRETIPGGGIGASDEAPAVAPSAETASAPVVSTPSETTVAPATGGIGVLIVNLGTPDAPTPAAVRRYLKEFLSDRRVIEKNSLLW